MLNVRGVVEMFEFQSRFVSRNRMRFVRKRFDN